MNKKYLLALLLLVSCSLQGAAQADYYYYRGQKIPLTVNVTKVCVNISKEDRETSERVLAKVHAMDAIRDEAFGIYVISRADFESMRSSDSWEEDAKSVILTPVYFTESNAEVVATPYLDVRLKKAEDAGLLNSYAEKYGLRVVGNSSLMPLWYTLAVTQDSDKSPVECANELFESGDFASSVPDLAELGPDSGEVSTVGGIAAGAAGASPDIYDLQGRRLAAKPAEGVYIQRGKKALAK